MKATLRYFQIAILCLGLFSCEKLVDDLNVDPNNPSDATANLLLTGVELANITVHEGHSARVAGMWSGYFSGVDRQYRDIQNYNVSGGSFNQTWQNLYYGVLEQVKLIEERAQPVNNRLVMGIAKVIKAHAAGTAAALWGDVPYTEAANIREFPNPSFDSQAQVYESVQALLDAAIADLTSGIGTSPGAADIHFGGNAARWVEVAHTLKARFYMDTKNYPAAYEEAKLGIQSPLGSMMAPHGTSQSINENFFFQFQRGRAGDMTAQGAYITRVLDPDQEAYKGNAKTDERARLNYYFRYTGTGAAKAAFLPNTSTLGNAGTQKGFFAQNAAFPLVTYEENLLTLAEAGMRTFGFEEGLNNLNLYRAYLDGGGYIDATYRDGNFNYDAYVAEDFEVGGLANESGFSPEDALLQEILMERYVTFLGQKLGFNDLRRTRSEAVGVKITPNQGSVLPERFIYSQDEINSNANAPQQIPGIFVPTPINAK